MKRSYYIALPVLLLLACSRTDPIDRLMANIPRENVESYMFRPIHLPHTASAEMLVSNLTVRGELQNPKILEIRQTRTTPPPGIPVENFTAVLLDSGASRKIVVLLPSRANQWYFKIYDAR